MKIRLLLLPSLLIASAATSGCAVFVTLPETPGLANLSEDQVFSMAPPPEWPAPQADNPQTASIDVSCGIGPRLSTGQLYAAVSVKGRPGASAAAPLNVALGTYCTVTFNANGTTATTAANQTCTFPIPGFGSQPVMITSWTLTLAGDNTLTSNFMGMAAGLCTPSGTGTLTRQSDAGAVD